MLVEKMAVQEGREDAGDDERQSVEKQDGMADDLSGDRRSGFRSRWRNVASEPRSATGIAGVVGGSFVHMRTNGNVNRYLASSHERTQKTLRIRRKVRLVRLRLD